MDALTTSAVGDSPAQPARRRVSPRVLTVLAIVAAVVLIGVVAWTIRYRTVGRYLEDTNDAYVRADAVTVSPKIAGYVDQVLVADNQDVRAGQPLARIDARDYQAQAAQYRAQIDVARANADNVRAGIAEQRAAVDQARAQLATARADAAFAAGEVARYTPLAESGAEPREKLASLRNQAAQAINQVAAQAAALASAQRRIASLDAQVRQAGAQGEAAGAQLGATDINLRSALIRAPVAGRIGDKSVRVGQYVSTGTRLMTLVPVAALYVTANFKETQVGMMRAGQPATIRIDALPGVQLRGHVDSLSPGTGAQFSLIPPQNATGNFTKIVQRIPVRIAIDAGAEARAVLVPGMSSEVTVDTRDARDRLARIRAQEDARQGR